MGGHGGLNILPQKKWNVYNWDNRQIVEKDKKLHEQKKRKEFEDRRSQQLDNKMRVMREQSGLPAYEQAEQKPKHSLISAQMRKLDQEHKHVNLFEEEERILLNKEVNEAKRMKEEEFLKDKNMDFSSRFLGTYNDEKHMPWYSKKKGVESEKHKNRHFVDLDDVIYGTKTDSKITKQIIQAEKKEAFRAREQEERDRTRQKIFRRYEQYEDKCRRIELGKSHQAKELVRHEEDLLLKDFKTNKNDQMERMRQKRLRREQKERKRAQELKKKMTSRINI